jgi:hypothetical protein
VLAEKAFDEDQKLKQPKSLSINKVGHGMYMIPLTISFFSFICVRLLFSKEEESTMSNKHFDFLFYLLGYSYA